MSTELRAEDAVAAARRDAVAREWHQAIAGSGFVPLATRDVRARLRALLDEAVALLLAGPYDPAAARAIGAALVRLHFAQPEALGRTQQVLGRRLPDELPPQRREAGQARLSELLGDLASGFFAQARDTILDEQEAIRGALLTERQRAIEALRESEARFRAIYEGAAISIVVVGPDGQLLDTNPAMRAMLGYSSGEMRGRPFTDFAYPQDVAASWPLHRALMQGEREHYEVEQRFLHKDGRVLWGHITVSLVRDAEGRPRFAIAMGENITERKQAEAALTRQYREAELARSQMRATLDATGEAMLLVAPDGRILSANRRFHELFPLAGAEAQGRAFAELRDEFVRIFGGPAAVDALAASIPDAEQRFTRDVLQVWPDRRDLELFSAPVPDETGRPLGRLFAFRDVTRERAVDRMKSEFVSLVSHELRTPLTSIKGYIDLLLADDAGALNDEQRDFLDVVKSNSDRLVSLISDLLDISRMESGSVELQRSPVALGPLIEDVAASFRPEIERTRQRLRLDTPPDLPSVLGDPDRLVQVLTNLISNAHKYTPAGGHIEVAARPEGHAIRVDVRDSGIGISPQDQAQLFTRFFRAKNRATQEVGGTGLGLMITRSLVLMHGGDIQVESTPGEGSTFSFTLPLA